MFQEPSRDLFFARSGLSGVLCTKSLLLARFVFSCMDSDRAARSTAPQPQRGRSHIYDYSASRHVRTKQYERIRPVETCLGHIETTCRFGRRHQREYWGRAPPAILIKWVLQMALTGLSDRFDDLISAADHILQHEADYYGLSVHFAQVEPI
jgi:hypothetical protein